jgi:hypothetical protein
MRTWWVSFFVAVGLTQAALAWRPTGWVYFNGAYAFHHASQEWYWFGQNHPQWMYALSGADGWTRLQEGALTQGWSWHIWPYTFHHPSQTWHVFSANGRQRCVHLRTGTWSVFGLPPPPPGMAVVTGGTNAGLDPSFGAYSLAMQPFFMDQHEVTKGMWDEVRAWAIGRGYAFNNAGLGKASNHPVHSINWYDCVKWCNARSEKAGRSPVYFVDAAFTQSYRTGQPGTVFVKSSANGFRLPTAEQWQYAARGGAKGRRFPWSDSDAIHHGRANYQSSASYAYDTSPTPGFHPTYNDGLSPLTNPVGSFAPNGYGLYDMAGNVWEWCFNLYPNTADRVVCGGSWGSPAHFLQVGLLYSCPPELADTIFGFRTMVPALP